MTTSISGRPIIIVLSSAEALLSRRSRLPACHFVCRNATNGPIAHQSHGLCRVKFEYSKNQCTPFSDLVTVQDLDPDQRQNGFTQFAWKVPSCAPLGFQSSSISTTSTSTTTTMGATASTNTYYPYIQTATKSTTTGSLTSSTAAYITSSSTLITSVLPSASEVPVFLGHRVRPAPLLSMGNYSLRAAILVWLLLLTTKYLV